MKKYNATEKLFLSVMSVILGFGLIYAGARNVHQLYRLLNSSLDSSYSGVEFSANFLEDNNGISETGQEQFLPIINQNNPSFAPSLDSIPETDAIPGYLEEDNSYSGSNDLEQNSSLSSKQLLEPERLVIKSLDIDNQIIPVTFREVEYLGDTYQQWVAPNSGELGWHSTSARLGEASNVVINGHNSGFGETFRDLDQLENGDFIEIYAEDSIYTYVVANSMVLKERWESIETRMENASWINPSDGSRLTLISCWPYNSSTHRVIIVAVPYSIEKVAVGLSRD